MVRSSLALAALATTAVPGLDVVATRPPQATTSEYQTTGLLDAGGRGWVIRAPRTPAAGAALEGEVALLEQLAREVDTGRLPFDVARPVGFAELPEGGRAMVHRVLVGRALVLDELTPGPGLTANLARAIAAFHELDDSVIERAGLPVYDPDSYRKRRLAEVDEAARTGHVPSALLNRWEHALEDVRLWRFRPTPVHGDLAPEHVLVHEGRVSAVLGFADAHVGDPAEDLAWLQASAPEDSLDALEEAYALARTEGTDEMLLDRATLVSELALARWLLHGVRTGEQSVIDDAREMLRGLAEDVADAGEIGARHDDPPRTSAPPVPAVVDAPDEEDVPGFLAGDGPAREGHGDAGDRADGDAAIEAGADDAAATATEPTTDTEPSTAAEPATDEQPGRDGAADGTTEPLHLGESLPDFLTERDEDQAR